MFRIALIRPGSTDYDQEGRIQGTLDIPLNEKGISEVAEIIEEVRPEGIEVIYAPPCEPARQTAETIAAALHVKHKKLDQLCNLDHGLWQGMLIEDVRVKQPKVYRQWQEQPEIVRPPEGEMVSQAEERIRAAMAKLFKRHKEGVIALVVPEPLATLVRGYLKHEPLGDLWKAGAEHKRWELLEVVAENALTPSH
jgi:probable phosphoglycerate mutase